jgi:hypothetical protein
MPLFSVGVRDPSEGVTCSLLNGEASGGYFEEKRWLAVRITFIPIDPFPSPWLALVYATRLVGSSCILPMRGLETRVHWPILSKSHRMS